MELSEVKTISNIPTEIAGTPVETVRSGPRLPCPHEGCSFGYWSRASLGGARKPTVQDEFSPQDEPCEHFIDTWSPASTESLVSTLTESASSASTIYCVVDEDIPTDTPMKNTGVTIAIYVERQITLGGF